MSEIIFQKPWMLLLLPLVGVFIVAFRLRMMKRRQDMQAFGAAAAGRGSEYRSMEPWRLVLLLLATLLTIVALTRPAANPHPKMLQREGRDVVFLLDVSKSMLAEDRLPNRLQSAKVSIGECVEGLRDHRMGLVVFAGSSSIVCPLTLDKEFFLNSLEKAGPASVAHGGTRVGDALLKVCDKLFSDSDQGYKDIVLLTDGGDHGESLQKSLELVNERQVKLIVIGLGDEEKGARVPLAGGMSDYMVYKGQEVWSRLDSAQLASMVRQAEQGAYLAVGTRRMKLDDIYQRISAQEKKQQLAEESVIVYDEIFQGFIAAALLLLVMMAMIPHTLRRPLGRAAAVAMVLFVGSHQAAEAADMDRADAAYERGQYRDALAGYEILASRSVDAGTWYKKGNAQYRLAHFSDAVASYQQALRHQPDGGLLRDITYNLGNACFRASKKAKDAYAALSLVNQSVAMYRKVLLAGRDNGNAAVNMELARAERRKLQQQIEKEERRRQAMKLALGEIRKQLEVLILAQRENLTRTDEYLMMDVPSPDLYDVLVEKERAIQSGTDKVVGHVDAADRKFFDDIPPEMSPLGATKGHLSSAVVYEMVAVGQLRHHPHDSYLKEEDALVALRAALDALPRDPDGADKEDAEGDEGDDEGDTGEGDSDGAEGDRDSDSEGDEQGDMESVDAPKMNLESIDLPPPNDSPEDVIKRNALMQQARQAQGAKKKGEPVEKDW